jgi:hypothetical protein
MQAAQFVFYLLQGDEEAKRILSCAPQSERYGLFFACLEATILMTVTAGHWEERSAHLLSCRYECWRQISYVKSRLRIPMPVRSGHQTCRTSTISNCLLASLPILIGFATSSNVLISLTIFAVFAKKGKALNFCCVLRGNYTNVYSRAKTHEILSIAAGPLHFLDAASKIRSSISEQIFFLIPANQNRPLQILEIPLTANMKYERGEDRNESNEEKGHRVELHLQLRDTGFYILNGFKSAIDQVSLSFATNDGCDRFCQAVDSSLQNLLGGPLAMEKNGSKPRPKKQSRAVMIDLSQDVIINGDTQLLSPRLRAPPKISMSQRIDVSASRESSMSSPLEAITANEAGPMQLEKDGKLTLHDGRAEGDPSHSSMVEIGTECRRVDGPRDIDQVHQTPVVEHLSDNSVAPALLEPVRQVTVVEKVKGGKIPQQVLQHHNTETEVDLPVAPPSTLQQQSVEKPIPATPNVSDPIAYSEGHSDQPAAIRSSNGAHLPPSTPIGPAKSSERMALKPNSTKQLVSMPRRNQRSQPEDNESKGSRSLLKRPQAANAVPAVVDAVDWDEDLRADQDPHKDENNVARMRKGTVSRGPKTNNKKPDATKKAPKPSATKKKPLNKAEAKEKQPLGASVNAGLAATRPRRTAKSVSYDEQSEQDEQSQGTVRETTDVAGHSETKETQAATVSSNVKNRHEDIKAQPTEYQTPTGAAASSVTRALSSPMAAKAAAEGSAQKEALPSPREFETKPESTGDAESHPSTHDPSRPHDQKRTKTGLGHRVLGRTAKAEVEAVDDSHPMDKQQRANAISAARKSFGSALMDVMNESGMEPVRSANGVGAVIKPFGDKGAFVNSVKTALKQSPNKTETKTPGSKRQKHVQISSTNGRNVNPTAQKGSAKKVRPPVQLEGSKLHQQRPAEGATLATPPPATNAVLPMAISDCLEGAHDDLSPLKQERSDTHETRKTAENDAPSSNDIGRSSTSLFRMAEKLSEVPNIDKPSTDLSISDEAIPIVNGGLKRPATVISEEPGQIKRARKTDPCPETTQSDDKSIQEAVGVPRPTISNAGHGIITVPRTLEPSAREEINALQLDEATADSWTRQKAKPVPTGVSGSGHPQPRSLGSVPKLSQSNSQTPQGQAQDDRPVIPADDDLHRKAKIAGFNTRGPRSQGVPSSGKRGHDEEHSNLVPTETGRHIAFKKLCADAKVIEHPNTGVPKQSGLFGRHTKRKIQFSLSDRKSTDGGICLDEESADDTTPAPAVSDLENSKSVSQVSKVDENGSPRLHLRKPSRIPLISNGPAGIEDSRNVDDTVDATSVFECSESGDSETTETAEFGLETVVSNYTAAAAQMAAKLSSARSRPSIGLGNLLDHRFPDSSKNIDTNAFKHHDVANSIDSTRAPPETRSTNHSNRDQTKAEQVVSGGQFDDKISNNHGATRSFDIDQLRVSAAPQQPSSAESARVRRLQSSTPPSNTPAIPEHSGSPPSFNTRLRKMIMPPPPREPNKVGSATEYEPELHKEREKSSLMDAETTLVNGEQFEEEIKQSSPHRRQLSSSSSSAEEEGSPASASQQVPTIAFRADRRFWNQKLAETQQSLTGILEQVSHVSFILILIQQNATDL